MMKLCRLFLLVLQLCVASTAFSPVPVSFAKLSTELAATTEEATESVVESGEKDELIARRIIVEGDVQGGYYRSCVRNEVSCFL